MLIANPRIILIMPAFYCYKVALKIAERRKTDFTGALLKTRRSKS